VRVHRGRVGAVVEHHFLDVRQSLAGTAARLEEHRRAISEPLEHEALVIGAHGDHGFRAAQELLGQRAPAVQSHVEAFAQQVVAHVRPHDVRIVLGAGRRDDDAAIRAELAAQRIFRRQAAEDVAGANEEDDSHYDPCVAPAKGGPVQEKKSLGPRLRGDDEPITCLIE
jgi:hypothetical protein